MGRLDPLTGIPYTLEESAIYREYYERTLWGILRGEPDRSKGPWVARSVEVMAGDIFALSDYGRDRLPTSPILADRMFWSELYEGEIRWSIESADILTQTRLLLLAEAMEVAAMIPSRVLL